MDLITHEYIENNIFTIRGMQVMIDYHLAELYGVETKRLNEQVKRNAKRFPKEFMFRLTSEEWTNLQSQFATAKQPDALRSQNATTKRRSLPYVFTEQGVSMLSAVIVKELKNTHDRFLIIDQQHLYHIRASLKDLGKKWFAFSQMDKLTSLMLNHIKSAE
ncbi:MAG: ORF6N domain-containing protein [Prolixibacteraceae bacterium]|nr:ORF6N domain-containing protein [Prolixibacteraceae bacterium]